MSEFGAESTFPDAAEEPLACWLVQDALRGERGILPGRTPLFYSLLSSALGRSDC